MAALRDCSAYLTNSDAPPPSTSPKIFKISDPQPSNLHNFSFKTHHQPERENYKTKNAYIIRKDAQEHLKEARRRGQCTARKVERLETSAQGQCQRYPPGKACRCPGQEGAADWYEPIYIYCKCFLFWQQANFFCFPVDRVAFFQQALKDKEVTVLELSAVQELIST